MFLCNLEVGGRRLTAIVLNNNINNSFIKLGDSVTITQWYLHKPIVFVYRIPLQTWCMSLRLYIGIFAPIHYQLNETWQHIFWRGVWWGMEQQLYEITCLLFVLVFRVKYLHISTQWNTSSVNFGFETVRWWSSMKQQQLVDVDKMAYVWLEWFKFLEFSRCSFSS